MGVSALASCLMGKPVNKTLQTSDFGQRPLTAAQLHYAALDAAICLAIFSQVLELAQPKVQNKLCSAPWDDMLQLCTYLDTSQGPRTRFDQNSCMQLSR